MNKNIQFHIMSFCNSLVFFAPVAIMLRTTKGVTVSQFFLLQALLSVGIFLFEIPTGILADRIGYKRTLLLSQIMLFVARFLFLIADSLSYFVVEAMIEAFSCCFLSGTADAYLYEWCKQCGKEEKFIQENANAKAWGTAGFLISTIGYSLLYTITSLDGLVIATELATLVAIVAVLAMPEVVRQTNEVTEITVLPKRFNIPFAKIVLKIMVLDTILGVISLIINFMYAEKLNWIEISLEWMTPIILGYSALELLIPKIFTLLMKRNIVRVYRLFSMIGTGLLVGIYFSQNYVSIVFMVLLPFILGIVEQIQYKFENNYIDKLGQSHNRATLLSMLNMGNNLFGVVFLLSSAIVTSKQLNGVFLFAGILMIVVAIVGVKVIQECKEK